MRVRIAAVAVVSALLSASGCHPNCKCTPGEAPKPQAPPAAGSETPRAGVARRLSGMADLHAHVFAVAAFGGRWHWGYVEGPEAEALKSCNGDPRTHAGAGGLFMREELGHIPGVTQGDTGKHCKVTHGSPGFDGWPRWDTVAHMRYWEGHLKQAYLAGLRLMVVHAVDSLAMCQMVEKAVTHPASSATYDCDWGDSYTSLTRQIEMAKQFVSRHKDWIEIAYTSADARRIIGANKMAWVLGIEADYAWGSERTAVDLHERVQQYHTHGVRAMYLAHQLNTRLAGAAIYFKPIKSMQWIAKCFFLNEGCNTGPGWLPKYQIQTGAACAFKAAANYGEICDVQYAQWINSKDGFATYPGGGSVSLKELDDTIEKNCLGLTHEGGKAVRQMMDLGVLIDVSHISEKAIAEVAALSEENGSYPLYASHGYFRDRLLRNKDGVAEHFYNRSHEATIATWTARLIARTGGMVGHFVGADPESAYPESGVANDCLGSSRSFAQGAAWGMDQGVHLAFATDFMGMARGFAPRKSGAGQCLNVKSDQKKQKATPGSGDSGFDENGFSHIGMMGAALADLEAVGLKEKYLKQLRDDAAENFVQMWEKAESLSAVGHARAASAARVP
jgi:microsomal dipeptidase-like Zn-dependent dipeptidase